MSWFQEAKIWIAALLGLSKDAVHIYVGLAVFLICAALLRRGLGDWRALATVLLAALAGEAWDLIETQAAGERLRWEKSWKDVWNTCFWPAVLFALVRWTRLLRRQL